MPVIVMGTTEVAARLLRYTVKDKPGQSEPRVLHAAGVHCRPETAEREFAATRRRHGTQGATRTSPAQYELPGPWEAATHARRTRPNGRRYWIASDAAATHVRRDGELVRQAEARHIIVSFGPDEVNHDDLEQVAAAFEFVLEMQRALRTGIQAQLVGQADGRGRAFHVHIVENATLYEAMEVDGSFYEAGRKLAGDLTNINRVRERADEFLSTRGARFGLLPQRLPSVSEQKRETRNQRDRRMHAEGSISNHDLIRDAFEAAMDDPRATELDEWKSVMTELGVAVTEPGWRRGKPPRTPRLSYQLDGMSTPVRAATLGEHYDFASAVANLEANANGTLRMRRPKRVTAGDARLATQPSEEEITAAQEVVTLLARAERERRSGEDELARWAAERARHEGVAVGDLWHKLPESHDGRMRVMRLWNRIVDTVGGRQQASLQYPNGVSVKALSAPTTDPSASLVGQTPSALAAVGKRRSDSASVSGTIAQLKEEAVTTSPAQEASSDQHAALPEVGASRVLDAVVALSDDDPHMLAARRRRARIKAIQAALREDEQASHGDRQLGD